MRKTNSEIKSLYVRNRQHVQRVDFTDLMYIRAEGNYCFLQLVSGDIHSVKWSLRQLLARLPEEVFLRIHKSYVVNVAQIDAIDMKARELTINGEQLPIGRTYINELTEALLII